MAPAANCHTEIAGELSNFRRHHVQDYTSSVCNCQADLAIILIAEVDSINKMESQTAATSVSTRACSCLTLPAGIEGSPFTRRLSVSAFSLPVTTQRMRRERLMTGKVSVIRRRP